MDVFFQQYFDLDIMRDNFSYVLDGFWLTIQLSLIRACWRWCGAWSGAAACCARPRDAAGARARDHVHRRAARHPAAARDPADRRQPAGARLPADVAARPGLPRQAGDLLVRRPGDLADLRRLLRGGLPRRPRRRALRPDGGGALARHELSQGHAPRDRAAGDPQGDPADAERLHRPDEGHLARGGDRAGRGREGGSRGPGGDSSTAPRSRWAP